MGQEKETRVRLNKLIAEGGLASRRASDKMIEEGRVQVNGQKVYELGTRVDPIKDRILVDGKLLKARTELVYAMLNKPTGVLTTMEDPLNRPTLKEYLEDLPVRLFPVGRLDWDSEGLILLTNDGDYANRIMHPKEEVTKTYLVKVDGLPRTDQIEKLLRGVPIVGGRVSAKSVETIKRGSDQYAWLKIVITEGKNRQIRQMFEKIGYDVLKLQRVAIGRLRLGALKRGELVFLNEVAAERVFMPDESAEVRLKKSYQNRQPSLKTPVRPLSKSRKQSRAVLKHKELSAQKAFDAMDQARGNKSNPS